MKLNKINGNTYYIEGITNIGVYKYNENNVVLLDSGTGDGYGKRIDKILKQNDLTPKIIINTHNHLDHAGGNAYFKKAYDDVTIYASALERIFIENPEFGGIALYGGKPLKGIVNEKFSSQIDRDLEEVDGEIVKGVEIIKLPGHTLYQMGMVTEDRVCFLADSLIGEKMLKSYSLAYYYDLEKTKETFKKIREMDADYFIVSHENEVCDRDRIEELIKLNLDQIEYYEKYIVDILQNPMSIEEMHQKIVKDHNLSLSVKQYFLNECAIRSYITYLSNRGEIKGGFDNGKLVFSQLEN